MTAVEATSVTEEEQSKPLALRIGAELVGSFIICFAIYSICTLGSAIYGVNMAFIALLTGLVYAAATLIFGTISGAQFNPAVSVAAMLSGKTHTSTHLCRSVTGAPVGANNIHGRATLLLLRCW